MKNICNILILFLSFLVSGQTDAVFNSAPDAYNDGEYEKAIDFYISESQNPIIIKKLITRSPISKRTEKRVKFYTPLLEKILVDLFTENKLFYFYQGAELIHVYENALKNYTLNYTKLFSYAKRREREQDIKQFMTNNVHYLVKDLIE